MTTDNYMTADDGEDYGSKFFNMAIIVGAAGLLIAMLGATNPAPTAQTAHAAPAHIETVVVIAPQHKAS